MKDILKKSADMYGIPYQTLVKVAEIESGKRFKDLFNDLLFHTYGPRWGAIVVDLNSFSTNYKTPLFRVVDMGDMVEIQETENSPAFQIFKK